MPNKTISLELNRTSLRMLYLDRAGDRLEVLSHQAVKFRAEDDIIAGLSKAIREFLRDNSISTKKIYFTLSGAEAVAIKNFVLPAMPKSEILEALKWQLKEEPPFDLEHALFDYQIVKDFIDEDGTQKNIVMVTLADSRVLRKYLSAITQCNLDLVRASISPFNYSCLLENYNKDKGLTAVLDIGYSDSALCIYRGAKLTFVRRLVFSTDKINQALSDPLVTRDSKGAKSYQEIEKIKEDCGIFKEGAEALAPDDPAMRLWPLLRPLVEGLVRELRYSFTYFITNFKEENPAVLYLTGEGSNLRNLDWYLKKELSLEASLFPLPVGIKGDFLKAKSNGQYTSALGAVLAPAAVLDLVPYEFKVRKFELLQKSILRQAVLIAAAILLTLFFFLRLQFSFYSQRLKVVQAHLATLGELAGASDRTYPVNNLVNQIQKGDLPAEGLLKLVSSLLPDEVSLSSLKIDNSGKVALRGTIAADSQGAAGILADYSQRLRATSLFSSIKLLLEKSSVYPKMFSLECKLKI